MKRTYRIRNEAVGTVKKSIAAITSRWFRTKVIHPPRARLGGQMWGRYRETVRSETLNPSFNSSP
jgi:hypothetical protein